MTVVAILAGGTGTRMNNVLPKQFIEINGKPVIVRTLESFLSNDKISRVYLAINMEWKDYCVELLKKWNMPLELINIVPGGESRFKSMYNVIDKVYRDGFAEDNIIIQDCARPFVPKHVIDDLIESKNNYDMVTACTPTIETIVISSNLKIIEGMPPRSTTLLNQGPQIFNVKESKGMIDTLTEDEKLNFIEAGIMYFSKNKKVGIINGSPYSFKITTEFDLKLANLIAKELDDD